VGKKGATKKPFWAKAQRGYVCFNCEATIAEGEDVLIFQPLTMHDAFGDKYRTRWDFACAECGPWEVSMPIHTNKGEANSYGGSYV
jgi:hypothetical protein